MGYSERKKGVLPRRAVCSRKVEKKKKKIKKECSLCVRARKTRGFFFSHETYIRIEKLRVSLERFLGAIITASWCIRILIFGVDLKLCINLRKYCNWFYYSGFIMCDWYFGENIFWDWLKFLVNFINYGKLHWHLILLGKLDSLHPVLGKWHCSQICKIINTQSTFPHF